MRAADSRGAGRLVRAAWEPIAQQSCRTLTALPLPCCGCCCRHVHTAQIVQAAVALLSLLGAPQTHSDALRSSTRLLQTLVVAVVSALVGLALVLAAVRQHQVVRKARSLTPAGASRQPQQRGGCMVHAAAATLRVASAACCCCTADWWHGWRARLYVAAYAMLLAALWVVAAALVGLLCAGATVTLLALAGDAAAGAALR